MHFRHLVAASAAALVLLTLAGCTGASNDPAGPPASASAEPQGEKLPNPKRIDLAPFGSPTTEMSADGFDPSSLSITVGEIVIFTSDDRIHALSVNGQSDVTVSPDLPALYKFSDAGTYEAIDVVSGATVTVTVNPAP